MDEERKYLEGLLKDRFNFFLVFASLIIAGVVTADEVDPAVEQAAYIASILVSSFIWLAVLRTNVLVNRALNLLSKTHPYRQVTAEKIKYIPARANSYLVVVAPLIIILMFFILLWRSVVLNGWALLCTAV